MSSILTRGCYALPILKMGEEHPERLANLLGVFWNLNACIHQLDTCLFNFRFMPGTGMYRWLRPAGSLGSVRLTEEGRQAERVKDRQTDGGPPGGEGGRGLGRVTCAWGQWGGRVRNPETELQVRMWSRPRPPSLVKDWIFLYMMGGPGRI